MLARAGVLGIVVVLVLAGCAGRAWRQAEAEDNVAAYHGFLKEYADSSFAPRARARLELVRVREKPSLEAFRAFREAYESAFPELVEELRPHVEEAFFRNARVVGAAKAYRAFLKEFPDGALAARARGNTEFLARGGFGGDPEALAAFARRHPESDYAAEAERSAASVAVRSATAFRRVGLVVQIDPRTPGADRVERVFRERARAAYASAGLELVPLAGEDAARAAGVPALLRIAHREYEVGSRLEEGRMQEPAVVAETRVALSRLGDEEPIWQDTFEYRTPLAARRADVSILFGPGARARYWAEIEGVFFVPIARWNTRTTARAPQAIAKPAVALEVDGSRAVVLFGDGEFQLYELSDPESPLLLGTYRRPRDLATYTGVRLAGRRVALYGPDGIEIVRLDGPGPAREARHGRDEVGSIVGLEAAGDGWVAAGKRGLLWLGRDGKVQTLVPREILGLARVSGRLLFTDGRSLYEATPRSLRAGRVEAELRLGRGFEPARVRVQGESAVVLGRTDVVRVDVSRPGAPRIVSRIGGRESGRIADAAVVGGRLFLLGPRGLQVVDARGERVVDSVDVSARGRLGAAGRHLVMIGGTSLQVVDATPFVAETPAAPRR